MARADKSTVTTRSTREHLVIEIRRRDPTRIRQVRPFLQTHWWFGREISGGNIRRQHTITVYQLRHHDFPGRFNGYPAPSEYKLTAYIYRLSAYNLK